MHQSIHIVIRARALDRFAALLAPEVERAGRAPVAPLIHQALVAAVEGVSIHILQGEGRAHEINTQPIRPLAE